MGGSGQDVVDLSSAPQKVVTATGNVTVDQPNTISTTTTLAPFSPSPLGQPATLSATVTASNGSTPAGSVEFVDETTGQVLGTATLNGNSQASITTSALAGGLHTVAVFYTPASGSSFQTDTNPGQVQVVTAATPTVSVSDAGGTYNGSTFEATATVTGLDGTGSSLDGVSPTFTYYAGNSASGTPLAGAPTNAGTYTVVASYPADRNYTSASDETTFTIAPAPLRSAPRASTRSTTLPRAPP